MGELSVVGEEDTKAGSLKWICPKCGWDNFSWPGVSVCTTCDTEVVVRDPIEECND